MGIIVIIALMAASFYLGVLYNDPVFEYSDALERVGLYCICFVISAVLFLILEVICSIDLPI